MIAITLFISSLLLIIQRISVTDGATCQTQLRPNTFIRCCRLDEYFRTATIDECIGKCHQYNHNSTLEFRDKECSKVNWHRPTEECSLLYTFDWSSFGAEPDIMTESFDYVAAELFNCTEGDDDEDFTTTPLPTSSAPPPKGVGCGLSAPQYRPYVVPRSRIIGGDTAKNHSWPWIVSLRMNDGAWHFCGGTLLRVSDDKEESDIVLTAAHCVPVEPNGTVGNFAHITVVAGTHSRSPTDLTAGEERRKVSAIKYHEHYAKLVNDVAILKLEKPILFSDTIRPVCLPRQNDTAPVKRTCIALGWGRNESDSKKSQDELKQATSPVHATEFCQKNWYWKQEAWSYALLCAGPIDGSSAVCNGDSGGPLICRYEDGSWIQQGIASFVANQNCTNVNMPPVFARVSTYVKWIRQKIATMSALLN